MAGAIERAFSELPPGHLYLDTNFILSYLIPSRPHHERCQSFLQRLFDFNLTSIYISSLSWLEFTYVMRREDFRTALPEDWQERYSLDQWQEVEVRRRYIGDLCQQFRELLDQFESFEIALTADVRESAIVHITDYNLGPHDAVHLASARSAGVIDLASFDRGFRRVEPLYLWNDRIFDLERPA